MEIIREGRTCLFFFTEVMSHGTHFFWGIKLDDLMYDDPSGSHGICMVDFYIFLLGKCRYTVRPKDPTWVKVFSFLFVDVILICQCVIF